MKKTRSSTYAEANDRASSVFVDVVLWKRPEIRLLIVGEQVVSDNGQRSSWERGCVTVKLGSAIYKGTRRGRRAGPVE
jgi:hypothetical protein